MEDKNVKLEVDSSQLSQEQKDAAKSKIMNAVEEFIKENHLSEEASADFSLGFSLKI